MTPIKPRYRLGTQYHLDLAKDDATKIPERTLFLVDGKGDYAAHAGESVVRVGGSKKYDDAGSVEMTDVHGHWSNFFDARDLQPLI